MDEYLLVLMGPKQMDDKEVLVLGTISYVLVFVNICEGGGEKRGRVRIHSLRGTFTFLSMYNIVKLTADQPDNNQICK